MWSRFVAGNVARSVLSATVRQALDALRAETLPKAVAAAALTQERVVQEVARLAFVDVAGVFDDRGNLKPFSGWTEGQRAALAGFEVIVKKARAGDGETGSVHKIKMADKLRALELAARILKMLVERHEVSEGNWEELAARLASARQDP